MRGVNDRIGKIKEKVPSKDKWKTLEFISLIPLVGVNHRQPILHMYKRIVHFYSIDESIIQFAIGYMINPPLMFKELFREQVEKCLSSSFHKSKLEKLKTLKYKE